MRIGVSATYMASGNDFRNAGISRYSRNLLDALFRADATVQWDVFLTTETEAPGHWHEHPHVRVHSIVPGGRGKRALWDAFGAGREVRERKLDLWFATAHATPGPLSVPRVTMIHDMVPYRFPGSHEGLNARYLRWVLVRAPRASKAVLTNSEVSKGDIVRYARISESRITVLRGGPGSSGPTGDRGPVEPQRIAALGIPHARYILTLGTLEPRKNIAGLLTAFGEVVRRGGHPDLGLAVAGGRGWLVDGIEDQIAQLGIADRVTFLGYVPDAELGTLLAGATGFVYPSIFEGYGLPVLEAMLGGAPVATSRGTAMEEIGGDAVQYFDPQVPSEIADAIEAMAEPGFDRAGAIARQDIRAAQFTWEESARQALAVFRQAVGK